MMPERFPTATAQRGDTQLGPGEFEHLLLYSTSTLIQEPSAIPDQCVTPKPFHLFRSPELHDANRCIHDKPHPYNPRISKRLTRPSMVKGRSAGSISKRKSPRCRGLRPAESVPAEDM